MWQHCDSCGGKHKLQHRLPVYLPWMAKVPDVQYLGVTGQTSGGRLLQHLQDIINAVDKANTSPPTGAWQTTLCCGHRCIPNLYSRADILKVNSFARSESSLKTFCA